MLNPLQQYIFVFKLNLTVNAKGWIKKKFFYWILFERLESKEHKIQLQWKPFKDNVRTFKDIWSTVLEPKPE